MAPLLPSGPGSKLHVVNTHDHFDHWFGNGTLVRLAGLPELTFMGEATWVRDSARRVPSIPAIVDEFGTAGPTFAAELATLTDDDLRPPALSIARSTCLDLGDRTVEVRWFGRGHTDHDLVILVPDAGVIAAGDLVEVGADPAFEDAWILDWPDTLTSIIAEVESWRTPVRVVPGHGAVVDLAFVRDQRDQLAELAAACRTGLTKGLAAEQIADRAPFEPAATLTAIRRILEASP